MIFWIWNICITLDVKIEYIRENKSWKRNGHKKQRKRKRSEKTNEKVYIQNNLCLHFSSRWELFRPSLDQFDHIDESSSWAMNFTSKNHRNDLKYNCRCRYLSLVHFQKGKKLGRPVNPTVDHMYLRSHWSDIVSETSSPSIIFKKKCAKSYDIVYVGNYTSATNVVMNWMCIFFFFKNLVGKSFWLNHEKSLCDFVRFWTLGSWILYKWSTSRFHLKILFTYFHYHWIWSTIQKKT